MTYEQILYSADGEVGVITLNRPERMNAWTHVMCDELTDAISACNQDPGIGAMVITGAGRGFCAGADIKQNFQARIEGQDPERTGQNSANWVSLLRSSKPIVAAVNGASVGVGLTMILPFDVIIASEAARFAMAFIKMGLVPELASSHFLVQRMGFGRASEMCLSGRMYDAAEAHAAGLVDRVAKPEELLDTALEMARSFAANPTPQLRWVKQLLTENGSATDLTQVQKREGELLQEAYQSPEHKEAVAAFLEKRPADFRKLTG
ncbi:MAG: enoyl-CoA hydratase-related protein [Gammaproteobacteria bacterium]|nr:enoyl-CoA hydratase-related protein [Gammaproteobacteria bacterium]